MKTIKDLCNNWKDVIVEGMGMGHSKEKVIIKLGLTWPMHVRLARDYAEYKKAMDVGELHLIAFVKDLVMQAAEGKLTTQPSVLIFMAKNMLGWRSEPFVEDKKGGLLTDKTEEKEILGRFMEELDEKKKKIKSIN